MNDELNASFTAKEIADVIKKLKNNKACGIDLIRKRLHRLQVLQNSAARLITGTRRREHISPVLFALHCHWLPIRQRIKFKLLVLVYRCLHQLSPAYLSDLIIPYTPARSLCSADSNLITTNLYRLSRALRSPPVLCGRTIPLE